MAFPVILTGGLVTVNAGDVGGTETDLINPAWGTHDEGFSQLALSPQMVGGDVNLIGEYTSAQPQTPVATTRSFPLFVVTECDHTGAAHGPGGVWSNLAYLRTHVFSRPDLTLRPDGTRYTTLTLPNGDELWADCRFSERVSKPTPTGWFMTVDCWIRQGAFLPLDGS